jgi:hypothetical protein
VASESVKREPPCTKEEWFWLFDPWSKERNLERVRECLDSPWLNAQDEWGLTALGSAVAGNWLEAAELLLHAHADTELRYYRTGTTVLYHAVQDINEPAVRLLLGAGANPDAANYFGLTPREWAKNSAIEALFSDLPIRRTDPEPLIQNAEQLADHYGLEFEIPSRDERESLVPGQAVNLYIYGKNKATTKVRIQERSGTGSSVRYVALLDPLDQETNLKPGTTQVSFGPEHVATVFVLAPKAAP